MLEPWQKEAMQQLPPEMITHHKDYAHIPHPTRAENQDVSDIWTYVSCYVCHNAWYRDNPENPTGVKVFFLRVFSRKE